MALLENLNPILYTAIFTAFFGLVSTILYQMLQNWLGKRSQVKLILASFEQLAQLVDSLKETQPNGFFDLKVVRELVNHLHRVENLAITLSQSDYSLSKMLLEKIRKVFRVITDIDLLETYPFSGITNTGGFVNISDLSRELRDIRLSLLEKDIILTQPDWDPETIGTENKKSEKQIQAVKELMSDFKRIFGDVEARNIENTQKRRDFLAKLTDISADLTEIKRSIKDKYKLITM